MKKSLSIVLAMAIACVFAFSSPIIGGFSLDTPFLSLTTQPYSLYYYPGMRYEASYGMNGNVDVGFGFTLSIPWMNFSQLPISKGDLPIALGIAKAESAFQNYSVSSAGAQGLMQFMPITAPSFGVQNPYDPFQSVTGSLNYIKLYQKQFDSLQLAIAAYNAGPGAVSHYGGIPPYPVTQAYVTNVMSYISQYSSQLVYPEIRARLGIFGQYDRTPSDGLGNLTLGVAYPLPPGQMDICPEVTISSTAAEISWIWRANLMSNVYIALNHSQTLFTFNSTQTSAPMTDEVEISGAFGPITAILGYYSTGVAASGILNLWNQRLFGSISQSGEINYGVAFHLYKIYLNVWGENLPSSSPSYNVSLTGRW